MAVDLRGFLKAVLDSEDVEPVIAIFHAQCSITTPSDLTLLSADDWHVLAVGVGVQNRIIGVLGQRHSCCS